MRAYLVIRLCGCSCGIAIGTEMRDKKMVVGMVGGKIQNVHLVFVESGKRGTRIRERVETILSQLAILLCRLI